MGPSPLYYGGVPPTQRLSFRYVKKPLLTMRVWILLLVVMGRVHAETEREKARRTLCLKLPALCPQASGL